MMDMLVRLYDLPDIDDEVQVLKERGILIRRPGAYERHLVADWVGRHFSPKWVSETKTAFARQPISCFIATREKQMIGFACYDVTARGFLGPMGVGEEARKSGVGRVLLVSALRGLRDMGHAYGIIGVWGLPTFMPGRWALFPLKGVPRHLRGYFAGTAGVKF